MKRSLQAALVTALALLFTATSANAATIGIVLGIDASGSISNTEYQLQIDAYASVLGSLLPADDSIALGVYQFGVNVEEVFALQVIDATAKASLLTTLGTLNRAGINTGGTNIGGTIEAAEATLLAFGLGNITEKALIDISTDGFWNVGSDPSTAAANAIASGIDQVNCLGVGGGANCDFVAGVDSFSLAAAGFGDFQAALELKLETELGPPIPEPGAALLFGLGSLVIGWGTRRR
jgi:hypothetical protein